MEDDKKQQRQKGGNSCTSCISTCFCSSKPCLTFLNIFYKGIKNSRLARVLNLIDHQLLGCIVYCDRQKYSFSHTMDQSHLTNSGPISSF